MEAYQIQEEGIRLREKEGEIVVAYKMGLTSEAKRQQMGLHEAIYGVLTHPMQLLVNQKYSLKNRIHPKAEPEIAFQVDRELDGRVNAIGADEAWEAVTQVAPAIEVLDSRYLGFKYFSLPDVIADNASSSDFLIGNPVARPNHWKELENWSLQFSTSGQESYHALATEISGSPIRSLTELVSLLAARGLSLPRGSWVLLGAATPAIALSPGMQVKLSLEGVKSEPPVSELWLTVQN
jgi:2-oxo-3-hexenedioate decarboxylase